ncbi:uncharacterized protein RAG0_02788 [Rhynchosporium agropyri]|uniref:Transcription factor CBF/NF-Y/archaeal histone domain-containing protein n=1 Tax=Rhynchosporium agropyri TaxID=914238 RepID=A0A1E1K2M6_9HELO|nr:uncharacterized protein RAG0_02788 [Rhynchosporium agropyri]
MPPSRLHKWQMIRSALPNVDCSDADLHGLTRSMRKAPPDDAKISKEAKECMQKCVGEFISFITSEAAEKVAENDGYGTLEAINCNDILASMSDLGFEDYAKVLRKHMSHYRGARECARRKYDVDKPQQKAGLAQRNNNFHSEQDTYYELDDY